MSYTEYALVRKQVFIDTTSDRYPSYANIGGDGTYVVMLSFTLNGLPKDSVINSAYIQFTSNINSVGKSTPVGIKYYSRLVEESWWSESRSSYDAYTKSAGESESITIPWVTDNTYNSIDIAATIQESVDLFDYFTNRDIIISIEGNGNSDDTYVRCVDFSSAPVLFIDFSYPDEPPAESTLETDDIAAIEEPSYYSYTADAYIGYQSAVRNALIRFPNLPVTPAAVIASATLTLSNTYGSSTNPVKIAVTAIKAVNADCPVNGDKSSYDALTLTDASVLVEIPNVAVYGTIVDIDVSSIIEEIVSLSGWSAWDSIVFSLKDNGTSQTEDNTIYIEDVVLNVVLDLSSPPGIGTNSGMLLGLSQAAISSGVSSGFFAGLSQAAILDGRSAGFKAEGAGLLSPSVVSAGATLNGAGLIWPFGQQQGMSLSLSGWIEPSAIQSGMFLNIILPPGFELNPLGRQAGFTARGSAELGFGRSHGMAVAVEMQTFADLSFAGSNGLLLSGAMALSSGISAGLHLTGFKNNVLSITSGRRHGFEATCNLINGYLKANSRKHGLKIAVDIVRSGYLTTGVRAGFKATSIKNGLGYILSGREHGLELITDIERTGYLTAGFQAGLSTTVVSPAVVLGSTPLVDSVLLLKYRRDYVA